FISRRRSVAGNCERSSPWDTVQSPDDARCLVTLLSISVLLVSVAVAAALVPLCVRCEFIRLWPEGRNSFYWRLMEGSYEKAIDDVSLQSGLLGSRRLRITSDRSNSRSTDSARGEAGVRRLSREACDKDHGRWRRGEW